MKEITSVAVAEALLSIFARLGFPKEILSDQGSQFNSELMKQFHALCGTHAVRTSPYHPQANGTVERFHGTLKAMLRKVVHTQPKAWHRYLPALLFACRELPSESTGFSPFELMFGRSPKGPISLIADSWTQGPNTEDAEAKPIYAYLFELKNFIAETSELAKQNSEKSSKRGKKYFDQRARQRTFDVGDEVLVLLPTNTNKLLMTWSGPYQVQECLHPDYKILVRGRSKIFHANMLKQYVRRGMSAVETEQECDTSVSGGRCVSWNTITTFRVETVSDRFPEKARKTVLPVYGPEKPPFVVGNTIAVVQDEDDLTTLPTLSIPMASSMKDEDISSIDFDKDLSEMQKSSLHEVFSEFAQILTTLPGSFFFTKTTGAEYADLDFSITPKSIIVCNSLSTTSFEENGKSYARRRTGTSVVRSTSRKRSPLNEPGKVVKI